MEIKHPRILATLGALTALTVGVSRFEKNADETRPASFTGLEEAPNLKNFSIARTSEKDAKAEDFSQSATIEKYYPGLSDEYKKNLISMLKECKEKSPELFEQVVDALTRGVSPKYFVTSQDDTVEGLDFKSGAEFLLSRYYGIGEPDKGFIPTEDGIIIDRLIQEADLLKYKNTSDIQGLILDGSFSKDEISKILNSNPSAVVDFLLRPISDAIKIASPQLNAEEIQTLALSAATRHWLDLPTNIEELSEQLRQNSLDPNSLLTLRETLSTIKGIEDRAASISNLDMGIFSQAPLESAARILESLEQKEITPTQLDQLVQFRGKYGFPEDNVELLEYLANKILPDNELPSQLGELLEQINGNEQNMALLSEDAHVALRALHPLDAEAILKQLPNLVPQTSSEFDDISNKVLTMAREYQKH